MVNQKYPSLKNELTELAESLTIEPTQGTALGNDTIKFELASGLFSIFC